MNKPNFKSLQNEAKRVAAYGKTLESILSAEETVRSALQKSAFAVYKEGSLEQLKTIPVERLSFAEHDLPIGPLKEAGFTNIYSIRTASYGAVQKVPGVETKDIARLFNAAAEIEESVRDKTWVRLDPDANIKEQDDLVLSLFRYIYLKDTFKAAHELREKYEATFTESVPRSTLIRSSMEWVFSSRSTKEKVSGAAEDIHRALREDLVPRTNALIHQQRTVMAQSVPTAWADFEKQPALYYARLEEYLDKDQKETTDSAFGGSLPQIPSRRQAKSARPLPAALAEEVEKVELDLHGLNATLRSYQTFGVQYMLQQEKTLLGDEMGLGKTMQALAGMVHLRNKGATHFLVICPASVLINWKRETEKFTNIPAHLMHGKNMLKEAEAWRDQGGIGITNYESLPRLFRDDTPNDDIDDTAFRGIQLSMLVVDEAHFVKNPAAKRTENVRKLTEMAQRVTFMTGTPLENNEKEMRNLIGMLDPELSAGLPANAKKFEKEACIVYLRRLRGDVLQELPEKVESDEWVDLTAGEKVSYYADVIAGNFMAMRQVSWNTEKPEDSSKAARLKELVDMARQEKQKVIVFSFFLNTLERVKELFGDAVAGPITGSVPTAKRQEIIDEFSTSEEKTVLACQAVSGGTGLNIQAASVVIFCEPQIKPSIETQAISRAYRMGQVHKVLVYRLLADNTVDERIVDILKTKQEIFDAFAEHSSIGDVNVEKIKTISVEEIIQKEKEAMETVA